MSNGSNEFGNRAAGEGPKPVAWVWRYEDDADWRDAVITAPDLEQETRRRTRRVFAPAYLYAAPQAVTAGEMRTAIAERLRDFHHNEPRNRALFVYEELVDEIISVLTALPAQEEGK